MLKSQVAKGVAVKYDGVNRSYLKQYPKATLTGEYSAGNHSALVEFFNAENRRVDTAWIGLDYVTVVSYTHQNTIDELQKKKDDLLTQVAGFDAAISALKSLG